MNSKTLKKQSCRKQIFYTTTFMLLYMVIALQAKAQIISQTNAAIDSAKLTDKEYTCEDSLWNHVFMKYRLRMIERCKQVTGVIMGTKKSGDGDVHFLLKLDAGQEKLLNTKNITKQEGCLVLEPICITKVVNFFVGKACVGYVNKVTIPKVGDHVEVTGSLVRDGVHGWNEIHPVTKITVTAK
ncbi:hypothetical protein QWZ08_12645 [Ferruginibacter paludis]|uniref:hypothetical protein n=1 Tax=Ferruginibacter paludis TaxID=1310417 RepID=UPI0025B2EEB8|nr:hypothetical protein [Ferruginibacter paludis]MDN3656485.1 hypothetical protein [Ferruginibacter paludis]